MISQQRLRCSIIAAGDGIKKEEWCNKIAKIMDTRFIYDRTNMSMKTNRGTVKIKFDLSDNIEKIHDIDFAIIMFDCSYPFSLCEMTRQYEKLRDRLPIIPIIICGMNREKIEFSEYGRLIGNIKKCLYGVELCCVSVEKEVNLFEPLNIAIEKIYGNDVYLTNETHIIC